MSLIWFLVIVILVAIVVSIVWQAFGVGVLLAGATPGQRLLIALLGLVIIIAIVWYVFFEGHLVALPS